MKKIWTITIFCSLIVTIAYGQTGKIKKAEKALVAKHLNDAKDIIDEASYNAKNGTYYWVVYSMVYNQYALYSMDKRITNKSITEYLQRSLRGCENSLKLANNDKFKSQIESNINELFRVVELADYKYRNNSKYDEVKKIYEKFCFLPSFSDDIIKDDALTQAKQKFTKSKSQELRSDIINTNSNFIFSNDLSNIYWQLFIDENDEYVINHYKNGYFRINRLKEFYYKYKERFPNSNKTEIIKGDIRNAMEDKLKNNQINIDQYKRDLEEIGALNIGEYEELKKLCIDWQINTIQLSDNDKPFTCYSYIDPETYELFLVIQGLKKEDQFFTSGVRYRIRDVKIKIKLDNTTINTIEIVKPAKNYNEYYWNYEYNFKKGLSDNKTRLWNLVDDGNTFLYSISLAPFFKKQETCKIVIHGYFSKYGSGDTEGDLADLNITNLVDKWRSNEYLTFRKNIGRKTNLSSEDKTRSFKIERCNLSESYNTLIEIGGISFKNVVTSGKLFDGEIPNGYCQLKKINDKVITENNYESIIHDQLNKTNYLKLTYYIRSTDSDGLYSAVQKEVIYKMQENLTLTSELLEILKIPGKDYRLEYAFYENGKLFLFFGNSIIISELKGNGIFDLIPRPDKYFKPIIVTNLGFRIRNNLIKFSDPLNPVEDYFKNGLKYWLNKSNGTKEMVFVEDNTIKNKDGIIIGNKNDVSISPVDHVCDDCWSIKNAITGDILFFKWDKNSISISTNNYFYDKETVKILTNNEDVKNILGFNLDNHLGFVILNDKNILKLVKTDYVVN